MVEIRGDGQVNGDLHVRRSRPTFGKSSSSQYGLVPASTDEVGVNVAQVDSPTGLHSNLP